MFPTSYDRGDHNDNSREVSRAKKPSLEELEIAFKDIQNAFEPQGFRGRTVYIIRESLKNAFNLGKYLAGIAIFASLATHIAEVDARHQTRMNAAWQTVLSSGDQPGDAGRRNAIKLLSSSPRQFPLLWRRWEPQPLDGLEAPKAVLTCLDLSERSLYKANLSEADLSGTDFSGANLSFANFSNAKFNSGDIQLCSEGAEMEFDDDISSSHASLKAANLTFAKLSFSELSGVELSNAILQNADLSGADLSRSEFGKANLQGADLSNTNLSYVDLSRVSFVQESSRDIKGKTNTVLCGAILLGVDLRNQAFAQNPQAVSSLFADSDSEKCQDSELQVNRRKSPYFCGTLLPKEITNINPNRDCNEILEILSDRYKISRTEVKEMIEEARKLNK